jgi:hypothetical protein
MLCTDLGKGDIASHMLDLSRITRGDSATDLLPGGLGEHGFALWLHRVPQLLGEVAPRIGIQSHGGGKEILDGRCHGAEITGPVKLAQAQFQRGGTCHESCPSLTEIAIAAFQKARPDVTVTH